MNFRSSRRYLLAVVVLLSAAACGSDSDSGTADTAGTATTRPATAGTTDAVGVPTTERLAVAAPSLDGNLLGDPSELDVIVRTPASYESSGDRRYPVVYYLAGYGEQVAVVPLANALEDLVEEGQAPEMILVAVSGDNALGGSFYTDSPVSGNWASAIAEDLVVAIDDGYRTLAVPESRGIAGFSMGGFGAFDLAMRHPDVFGAVYALSPGLFAPGGLAESQMFSDPAVIEAFVEMQERLAALPVDEAAAAMPAEIGRNADVRFSTAYGAAFAPDPSAPPYVAYPYAEPSSEPDGATWARWESGYGGIAEEVQQYRDNLLALRGLVIDYGAADNYRWIPAGCEFLHEQLELAGIPHRLERFEGGHGPVSPRARDVMMPFFAEVLSADEA